MLRSWFSAKELCPPAALARHHVCTTIRPKDQQNRVLVNWSMCFGVKKRGNHLVLGCFDEQTGVECWIPSSLTKFDHSRNLVHNVLFKSVHHTKINNFHLLRGKTSFKKKNATRSQFTTGTWFMLCVLIFTCNEWGSYGNESFKTAPIVTENHASKSHQIILRWIISVLRYALLVGFTYWCCQPLIFCHACKENILKTVHCHFTCMDKFLLFNQLVSISWVTKKA